MSQHNGNVGAPDANPDNAASDNVGHATANPGRVGPADTSRWVLLGAAAFGLITLLCFMAFAYLALSNPGQACAAYPYLAPVFGLGLGLATAFVGGNAVAKGDLKIPGVTNPVVVGLGGGVAVVLIAFGIFNQLLPQCEIQNTRVLIKDIPSVVSFHVKYPHYSRRIDSTPQYDLDILPDTKETNFTVKATQEGRDICKLRIIVTNDIASEIESRKEDYEFARFNTVAFTLEYDNPPVAANSTKETVVSCAKWQAKPNPIQDVVLISPREGKAAVATGLKTTTGVDDDTAFLPDDPQSFALISPAFAAEQPPPFAEILDLLASSDDNARVSARRYLAQNFKTYSSNVVGELQQATSASPPGLIADLLSTLVDGMGLEDTDIVPGQGKKPGTKRDFSADLPFIAGLESKIVELTGYPDARVKKQARRLVQRYPFDSFKIIYDELADQHKNCSVLPSDAEQAKLYSLIFFSYNRIIDHNYSSTLSDAALADARESVRKAVDVSGCLAPDLKVDAAVVYYGLALILAEDKGKPKPQEAKVEAQKFLAHIAGMESKYYLQFHVDEMRRRVASSAVVN